jgi:hypothetical protein
MAINVTAMAQQQPFNPWVLPDSFTVYAFAPEEIRSFLHPHWQTQKAPHPMIYYLFGILYLVIGKLKLKNLNLSKYPCILLIYCRRDGYFWQLHGIENLGKLSGTENTGQYARDEPGRLRFPFDDHSST